MGSSDRTPTEKSKSPSLLCPHCNHPVGVTVAGLFIMHEVDGSPIMTGTGRWNRGMCRGSGDPAHATTPR